MKTKRITWLAAASAAAMFAVLATASFALAAGNNSEIAGVRSATARFHRTEAAQAEGWDLREGLDFCFDSPGVGGMGFHYINLQELQDVSEDPSRPEAFVYAPGPNGQRDLVAVEYIVPADAWDAAGNTAAPELLGQHFHLDPVLGVYELHVWAFKDNPTGMFEDFNPKVSCRES